MVKILVDRLQLINGKNIREFLHSELFDQAGLVGTDEQKMRQLEDRARPILQTSLEDSIPLANMPADEVSKTEPDKFEKYGDSWPMYIEGPDLICRPDTIDIRVTNLDPLQYIPWLGDARVYKTPPSKWWA